MSSFDPKRASVMPRPLKDRDFRIDLFRGLALWWIFIDHIPESYLNRFTLRNFGFSDAAEILVFLSGLASGIVYGDIARQSGLVLACLRIFRRATEIYVAQIVTLVLLLALVSYFAARQPSMLDHANLAILVDRPADTLLQATLLRYAPVNLDPLLLMVTLHFGLLVILPVMVRAWSLALIGSVALYVFAHLFNWYLPAYPTGQIYFNPLNWQLLFVLGIWWGANRGEWQVTILKSNVLAVLALSYAIFSFLIVLSWQIHSIETDVPAWLSRLLYPIDKNNLDVLRLLHFAALALLCSRFLPSNYAILSTRALRPLVQCGEYSLVVYCASVLLSFAGHAFLSVGWNSVMSQTLVSLSGLIAMSAIAALLGAMDRAARVHPRPL